MSDDDGDVEEATIYVTSADVSGRHIHYSRDCPRLQGNTSSVTEKPASVFPPGYYPDCEWCGPDSNDDGHSAEAGAD